MLFWIQILKGERKKAMSVKYLVSGGEGALGKIIVSLLLERGDLLIDECLCELGGCDAGHIVGTYVRIHGSS